jgi:drug/metabolite transporter (DMT)-like permease
MNKIILPILFVVLYGSGFVATKYGLPYSSPLSFLTLRFFIAGTLFALAVAMFKLPIPKIKEAMHIAIAGLLTVATFSIGVFVSIDLGLSPALSAMIIALQPILVGVLAVQLAQEKINIYGWIGLFLGFIGVFFIVFQSVDVKSAGILSVVMSAVGLLGLSFGNLYQKKFCADMHVITGGSIQSSVSAVACLLLLLLFDDFDVVWHSEFIVALLYMSIGVSLGTLSLLYIMISRQEVNKVASVFYLVPVSAAITNYLLYDEIFDIYTIMGSLVILVSVYLINKGKKI